MRKGCVGGGKKREKRGGKRGKKENKDDLVATNADASQSLNTEMNNFRFAPS